MEEQSSECINLSLSSTTVKKSYNSPEIKYNCALDTDLLRSGALQRQNKNAKETDDKGRNQLLNPSILHQDSPNESAVKYDDVCNPEDLKSSASYQNNSEGNATEKYDDVCCAKPPKSSVNYLQGSRDATKTNDSSYINDSQLSTVPFRSEPSKSAANINDHDRTSYTPKLPVRDNLSKPHTNQLRKLPRENNLYFEIDEQPHPQNYDLNRKEKQVKDKGRIL